MEYPKDQSTTPSQKMMDAASRVTDHALRMTDHALRMGDHAVSTVRVIISAEERLRQRIRLVLRVAVATIFFGISGLISLGATVTTAFAKKVNPDRGSTHTGLRIRRAIGNVNAVYHRHSVKHHHRFSGAIATKESGASPMRGVASWYGKQFHNRKTASGVRFDTHAMMAAHRTLPFGTKVRVTNLANQRSCVVEITDRGPFAHGRIIDLSHAAAEELGMMQSGVANVQLEVINAASILSSKDLAFAMPTPSVDRLASRVFKPTKAKQSKAHSGDLSFFDGDNAGH
jgi:rare lipoprotein A